MQIFHSTSSPWEWLLRWKIKDGLNKTWITLVFFNMNSFLSILFQMGFYAIKEDFSPFVQNPLKIGSSKFQKLVILSKQTVLKVFLGLSLPLFLISYAEDSYKWKIMIKKFLILFCSERLEFSCGVKDLGFSYWNDTGNYKWAFQYLITRKRNESN